MKTVDLFLLEIIKNNFYIPAIFWNHKDKRILESLANQLKNGIFLTENQGNLLLQILKEYRTKFEELKIIETNLIDSPEWSKNFRVITEVKNIKILDSNDEILIEFSYNPKIKEKLFSLSKILTGDISSTKSNNYTVLLSENNIVILVENLKKFNFKIDEKIMNFYNEIIDIKNKKIISFEYGKDETKLLQLKLNEDLGFFNNDNKVLLHDRKLKFQYKFNDFLDENCLVNKIAIRKDTDIWINSNNYSFGDVILSLEKLRRLPVLVIFDYYQGENNKKLLDEIHNAFITNSIEEKIGIYFRLDNNTNKDFNSKIAELGYNTYLDSETKLVGLSNKQLPKFLVKNQWKPSSAICFAPNFKNSKIYSYCDSVDLKICFSDTKPITGFDYAIM